MHQLAGRVRLDRDPGALPSLPQALEQRLGGDARVGQRGEEAPLPLEHRRRTLRSGGGEAGGEDPGLGRQPRVQLLGRGAGGQELQQARGLAAGDAQGAHGLSSVETRQPRRGEGGGEDAAGRGGVDAALVEGVRSRGGDTAHGLVADDGREQHLLPGRADLLAGGQDRRQHRRRRVDQATRVGVVEVEGVHEGAGREGGGGRRHPGLPAEQGGLGRSTEPRRHGDGGASRPQPGGSRGGAEPVEQVPGDEVHDGGGDIGQAEPPGPVDQALCGGAGRRGHAGAHPKAPSDVSAATVSAS